MGYYPETEEQVKLVLNQINEYDILACQIDESYISFAIEGGDGISFKYPERKELLKEFFSNYNGKLMYYDLGSIKPLIRSIYMEDYYDYEGMNNGIEALTKSFEDVKLITYLATNSCDTNYELLSNECTKNSGLKAGGSIWSLYQKHFANIVIDNQEDLYNGLFKESAIQILHMELVGMPINMDAVKRASRRLNRLSNVYTNFLNIKLKELGLQKINPNSPNQVQELLYGHFRLRIIDRSKKGHPATSVKALEKLVNHCTRRNQKMVIRCLINLSKVNKMLSSFIPKFLNATQMPDGSHRLFGNFHLGGTLSGRLSSSDPSLHQIPSSSTYAKLIKSCFSSVEGKIFSGADYASLEDVVNSLLTKDPNKLKVYEDGYDSHMLRTVNYLPEQFKHIKRGVEGEKYYSVNDVYMSSNDMFRTEYGTNLSIEELYQFDLGDYYNIKEVSHIEYDVYQINNLKKEHSFLREASKQITFPLQYFGTAKTLEDTCGLNQEEAIAIYNNYHNLYSVSKEWVDNKIYQSSLDGFSTLAFGLRLRTHKLATINWNFIDSETKAEARSAGNAMTQSYGLLTNRAANEFRLRVLNSEYRNKIQIVALIHDAIYLEFDQSLEICKWINDNLIECMRWNELPELQHDKVKLSANLEIFHPNWSTPTEIPNGSTEQEILRIFQQQ